VEKETDLVVIEKELEIKEDRNYADAMAIKVTDEVTKQIAGAIVIGLKALLAEMDNTFDPMIEANTETKRKAEAARKLSVQKKEQHYDKPSRALKYVLAQITAFDSAEQKRRDEVARVEQERIRKAEEDRRLKAAQKLEDDAKKLGTILPSQIPIGTEVEYHAIIGGPVTGRAKVSSPVQESESGELVVFLQGKAGYVSIKALTLPGVAEKIEELKKEAEKTLDAPIITPVVVAQKVEKLAGIETRRYWHARVIKAEDVPDVYKSQCKECGTLVPNKKLLNSMAVESKGKIPAPKGVEYYSDEKSY
jgi:hypothetical protein